jgi:ribosome-associated protein YbcJ (S4-like RNA binding protein)
MNKYFEQTFNSIYKIFVENGLINKNGDNEQGKNKKLSRRARNFV